MVKFFKNIGSKILLLVIFTMLVLSFVKINSVSAVGGECTCSDGTGRSVADVSNCPSICAGGQPATTSDQPKVKIWDPVRPFSAIESDSVPIMLGKAVKVLLGVAGSVFLLMIVYGGVIWMFGSTFVGGGATKKDIQKARQIILYAVLGLAVVFTSYAILAELFNIFQ